MVCTPQSPVTDIVKSAVVEPQVLTESMYTFGGQQAGAADTRHAGKEQPAQVLLGPMLKWFAKVRETLSAGTNEPAGEGLNASTVVVAADLAVDLATAAAAASSADGKSAEQWLNDYLNALRQSEIGLPCEAQRSLFEENRQLKQLEQLLRAENESLRVQNKTHQEYSANIQRLYEQARDQNAAVTQASAAARDMIEQNAQLRAHNLEIQKLESETRMQNENLQKRVEQLEQQNKLLHEANCDLRQKHQDAVDLFGTLHHQVAQYQVVYDQNLVLQAEIMDLQTRLLEMQQEY